MTPFSSCRYQSGSETCYKLAQALHELTHGDERELFDFGSRGVDAAPILLLLDRKEDPVTPLLMQWTYQAMVHELLGIKANRVDLPPSANVSLRNQGKHVVSHLLTLSLETTNLCGFLP